MAYTLKGCSVISKLETPKFWIEAMKMSQLLDRESTFWLMVALKTCSKQIHYTNESG